jgi:citrate synthase
MTSTSDPTVAPTGMRTAIGYAELDSIKVRRRDLVGDLMGKISFADYAFLLIRSRLPTEAESVLFNALLVMLADHGVTPTVIAARMTYMGAPESIQGAVAAGLLGGGSVFLGVTEDSARFLGSIVSEARAMSPSGEVEDTALTEVSRRRVDEAVSSGFRVPGIGHDIHLEGDPRTPKLYELAEKWGYLGPHMRSLQLVHERFCERKRYLPLNGAGAAGALLADLGFTPSICRGIVLIARSAGLVAHLLEEMEQPIGRELYEQARTTIRYVAPPENA